MLTDGEMAIVQSFAEAIPLPRRDAYLESVAVMLGQCAPPRTADVVHKVAAAEQHRFLHPPRRQRALHQARARHA